MGSVLTLSDLLDRMTGGSSGTPETIWFGKNGRIAGAAATAPIAGRMASLWLYEGLPSGAGAKPTTAAIPVNTTTGSFIQTDPSGGRQKYLTSIAASSLVAGTLILYDRLYHTCQTSAPANLDATSVSEQTLGTAALTRYTDGVGNFAFIEIFDTAVGVTGTTVKMKYYNQAGTSGQIGQLVTIGGTGYREITRAIMLPLASGDTGIQSVTSITFTGTTGTAAGGGWGVVVGHPLAVIDLGLAGGANTVSFAQGLNVGGLPEIKTDACLAFLWMPSTTTVPDINGMVSFVEA